MAITKTASTKTAAKKPAAKEEVKGDKGQVTGKAAVKPAAKPVAAKAPAAAKAAPAKAEVKVAPAAKAEVKASAAKAEVKAPVKSEKKEKDKGTKKPAPYVSSGEIRVELAHGVAGCTKKQVRTVQALGLKKIGDVRVHKDNPAIQGMVRVVAHLVRVEKVERKN